MPNQLVDGSQPTYISDKNTITSCHRSWDSIQTLALVVEHHENIVRSMQYHRLGYINARRCMKARVQLRWCYPCIQLISTHLLKQMMLLRGIHRQL